MKNLNDANSIKTKKGLTEEAIRNAPYITIKISFD